MSIVFGFSKYSLKIFIHVFPIVLSMIFGSKDNVTFITETDLNPCSSGISFFVFFPILKLHDEGLRISESGLSNKLQDGVELVLQASILPDKLLEKPEMTSLIEAIP